MKQVPKKSKKRNAGGTGTDGKRASSQGLDFSVRALLDASPESMFLMDIDGTVIECNETTAVRLGKTVPEIMETCIYDYLPPDVAVERKEHVLEVVRNGESITFEDTRGGRTFLNRIDPVFDERGGVRQLAVFGMDITERKQAETQREAALEELQKQKEELEASNEELMAAEEELRTQLDELAAKQQELSESEQKFHDTVKYLDEGYYSVTTEGLLLDHNLAFNRILGFDAAKDMRRGQLPDFWQNPDDRREYLNELMAHGFVRNFLINAKKITGEKIVVMASAHLLKDEKGRLANIDGTFLDVTELKRAEEALLLKNLVFDASIAANSIADLNGTITQANDAFLRLWGYSGKEEVVGRPLMEFISNEEEASAIINALNTAGAWEGDYTAKRKDLSTFIAHGLAMVVRDEKGALIGYQSAVIDITERKRAEEELRSASLYARSLIEASIDPLVTIGQDGKISDVNNSTEQVTGRTRKELIGTDFSDYFVEPEKAQSGYKQVFQDGSVYDYPLSIRHTSGKITDVLYNATVFRNEAGEIQDVFAAARDITERKRAEEELKQHREHLEEMVKERTEQLAASENKFRMLADFTYDWEYWLDADRRVIYVSPSCERITGYPPQAYYDDPRFIDTVVHPDDRQTFITHVDTYHVGREWAEDCEIEFRIIDRAGEVKWIAHDCHCITDSDGCYRGKRVSNRDVTQRKSAEEEARQYAIELESVNKELEAFSYSVSHDLRAPLRAIDGFTKILENQYKTKFDAEGIRLLNVIKNSTSKMGRLIDDLLAFSRLSRQEMKHGRVGMEGLAVAVSDELRAAAADRDIRFTFKEMPPAYCDLPMIRQVFYNLISNAVKYSKNMDPAMIEIGSMQVDSRLVYYVKDNGAGFDMQYADKLFGVFQRLHSAKEFEGTGVGLALVQRIVARHGGRVWAEGKVNEGATFYFSLPVKEGD